jgi:hypothetical protein
MAAWLSDTARSHGHGGFMADGPAILASPLWSRILQTLLPGEVFDSVSLFFFLLHHRASKPLTPNPHRHMCSR